MSGSKITIPSFLTSVCVLVLLFAVSSPAQSDIDPTFNAVPSTAFTSPPALQQIVQPGGKVIVFGARVVVDGVPKGDIFRLNADGSLDNTFSSCGCGPTLINNLMLLRDGRMVAGGSLGSTGKVIRINQDGSIDQTFQVSIPPNAFGGSTFFVEAVQADGRIFVIRRLGLWQCDLRSLPV